MGGVLSNEMNDIRGTTQKRQSDGSESSSKRQKQDSSVQDGSSGSNSSGSDGSSSSGLSDPLYSLAKIITRDREMRIKRLNKRIYDTEYSLWMGVDDDETDTNSGPLMYRYVLQRTADDETIVSQTTIVSDKSPDLELLFSYDASYVVFYTTHERSCECAACTSSVRSDFKSDSSDSGRSYNLVFNIYDTRTNRTETMCAYEKKRYVWGLDNRTLMYVNDFTTAGSFSWRVYGYNVMTKVRTPIISELSTMHHMSNYIKTLYKANMGSLNVRCSCTVTVSASKRFVFVVPFYEAGAKYNTHVWVSSADNREFLDSRFYQQIESVIRINTDDDSMYYAYKPDVPAAYGGSPVVDFASYKDYTLKSINTVTLDFDMGVISGLNSSDSDGSDNNSSTFNLDGEGEFLIGLFESEDKDQKIFVADLVSYTKDGYGALIETLNVGRWIDLKMRDIGINGLYITKMQPTHNFVLFEYLYKTNTESRVGFYDLFAVTAQLKTIIPVYDMQTLEDLDIPHEYKLFEQQFTQYDTSIIDITYESMDTPLTIVTFDLESKKIESDPEILETPGYPMSEFDGFITRKIIKIWSTFRDDEPITMSLNYRTKYYGAGVPVRVIIQTYDVQDTYDSTHTRYMYSSTNPNAAVLDLLDRGFLHVMVYPTERPDPVQKCDETARQFTKRCAQNFVDCARYLIELGITTPQLLIAESRTESGVLMQDVLMIAPELFDSVIIRAEHGNRFASNPFYMPIAYVEDRETGYPNTYTYVEYSNNKAPSVSCMKNFTNLLIEADSHGNRHEFYEYDEFDSELHRRIYNVVTSNPRRWCWTKPDSVLRQSSDICGSTEPISSEPEYADDLSVSSNVDDDSSCEISVSDFSE